MKGFPGNLREAPPEVEPSEVKRGRYGVNLPASVEHALRFWPIILPLLVLLPSIGAFPYPSETAKFSDLAITHYPNAEFLRRSLIETLRIPYWSDAILSGYPFFANPLSGLWYPPGWLALLFPLPLGLNLIVAVHILFGGLGLYALLKSEGLSNRAALSGGVAFAALPKLYAHYGAGHLTLLYAVSWTPWLLYASKRRANHSRWWKLASPGTLLALIFLADVRWFLFAWVLWIFYELAHNQIWGQWELRKGFDLARRLAGQNLLAGLLCAPLAVPLWEYTQYSTRANLSPGEALAFSMPISRLLGLLIPDPGGFHEWTLYPGAVVLLLALIALIGPVKGGRRVFWSGVCLFSLAYSLGAGLPLIKDLYRLPVLSLLRVPPRALFLSGMSLVVLAAIGLDRIIEGFRANNKRIANLTLLALVGFVSFLTLGVWLFTGGPPVNFIEGWVFISVSSLWILSRPRFASSPRIWYAGVLVIGLLDWSMVNTASFSPRPIEQVLSQGEGLAQYLSEQPGYFRTYSPSYSLPQQTAERYGLEIADGVDPLQLRAYNDYMARASGVPASGYGVTIPPFENGDPALDNASYLPDANLLGKLNVRYIAAEFDLASDGLVERARFGRTRLYENLNAYPRAWVEGGDALGEIGSEVTIRSKTPDRLLINATGPGTLVISEIYYPGWEVWIDGQRGAIFPVEELLRGVELAPGEHEIDMRFRPTSLCIGFALFLLGLIILVIQVFPLKQ